MASTSSRIGALEEVSVSIVFISGTEESQKPDLGLTAQYATTHLALTLEDGQKRGSNWPCGFGICVDRRRTVSVLYTLQKLPWRGRQPRHAERDGPRCNKLGWCRKMIGLSVETACVPCYLSSGGAAVGAQTVGARQGELWYDSCLLTHQEFVFRW